MKPICFSPFIAFFWWQADTHINIEWIDSGLVTSEYVKTTWILFLPLIPVGCISVFIKIWAFSEIYAIRKSTHKRMMQTKLVKHE